MDVAGAHVAAELGLPELLHDLGREKTCPGLLGEQAQHLELRAGQVDRLAAHRDEVAGEVDRDRPGLDRRFASVPAERSSSRRRSWARTRPSSSRTENGLVT